MQYEELVALKAKITAYANRDDYRLLNLAIAKAFHELDINEVFDDDWYVRVVASKNVTFFEHCRADTIFDDEERVKVLHALIPDYFHSLDAAANLLRTVLGNYQCGWSVYEDPSGASAKVTWWPEGISGSRQIMSETMQYTQPLSLIWCVIEVLLRETWFMKVDGVVVKYEENWGRTSPGVPLC